MTPTRQFKDHVFEEFARVGKALSSPRRLELLDLLSQAPRTVESLAALASLSVANTSQHLQALRDARLVEAERHGLFVTYRLAPGVAPFYIALRQFAEAHLAEIDALTRDFFARFEADPRSLEPLDRTELLRRALAGEVTVLDVRPPEEFAAGHLPTARSMPLEQLSAQLDSLPRERPIVAYCRGPWCVFAAEAVQQLRAAGFAAWRLSEGPAAWHAAGLPIEAHA